MKYVPDGLKISKIIYSHSESWGFGPGGHDITFVIYELPSEVALKIQKQGLAYLINMPEKHETNDEYYRHFYSNWQETPNEFKLRNFNFSDEHSGYSTEIDEKITDNINLSLSKKGSYIGHGRFGEILVLPFDKKVVFLHDG